MRRLSGPIMLGFILLAASLAPCAWSAEPNSASKFVGDLADRVLAIFNTADLPLQAKENRMYKIAVKDFDVPHSANFTLGRYGKNLPKAERDEFTRTFEHYIVHLYAGRFDLYHDVEFKVLGEAPGTAGRTVVRSQILRHDGGPPIKADWIVKSIGGSFKIQDVKVENVSELIALRDEFAEIIQHGDGKVSTLTDRLREKIRERDVESGQKGQLKAN